MPQWQLIVAGFFSPLVSASGTFARPWHSAPLLFIIHTFLKTKTMLREWSREVQLFRVSLILSNAMYRPPRFQRLNSKHRWQCLIQLVYFSICKCLGIYICVCVCEQINRPGLTVWLHSQESGSNQSSTCNHFWNDKFQPSGKSAL